VKLDLDVPIFEVVVVLLYPFGSDRSMPWSNSMETRFKSCLVWFHIGI